ncbi:MAG: hypothetical protein PHY16_18270 [Methylobacter sp.]|nr:hypothetical protein [Methylobacter sp.]
MALFTRKINGLYTTKWGKQQDHVFRAFALLAGIYHHSETGVSMGIHPTEECGPPLETNKG